MPNRRPISIFDRPAATRRRIASLHSRICSGFVPLR